MVRGNEVGKDKPVTSFNRLHSATNAFRLSTSVVLKVKLAPWPSSPSAGVMLSVITAKCFVKLPPFKCQMYTPECDDFLFEAPLEPISTVCLFIWLIAILNSPKIGNAFCMSSSSRPSASPVTGALLPAFNRRYLNTNKLSLPKFGSTDAK